MKFALIGCDLETMTLIRQIANHPQHQMVSAYECGPWEEDLRSLVDTFEPAQRWESLLLGSEADAVIIAADVPAVPQREEQRQEILKKLVQAGIPLLVVHPGCGSLFAYELNMIQADTGRPLVAWIPDLNEPALFPLGQWCSDSDESPVGRIEQIVLERRLPGGGRDRVLRQLARDAELFRQLVGRLTSVQAVAAEHDRPILANLNVSLTTHQGPLVRWNVSPVAGPLTDVLRLIGERGSLEVKLAATGHPWKYTIRTDETNHNDEFPAFDDAGAALREVVRQVEGHDAAVPWIEICRDLEVADTIDLSLRKTRSIDLIEEAPTEEGAFKGVMAASSCMLLMLTLLFLIVGSVVEGFRLPNRRLADPSLTESLEPSNEPPNESSTGAAQNDTRPDAPARNQWPFILRIWPAYPLLAFLLLQFLVFVARRKPAS